MFFDFSSLIAILQLIQAWFLGLWWLWLFFVLVFIAWEFWIAYIQEYFKRTQINFVPLEIKVPRELHKSPKAMEQVFFALHSFRNEATSFVEKWWDGEVTMWSSCEIVSFGGEIHFYMFVPEKNRTGIEAALYSQYPDIEVTEAEDYVHRFPQTYQELEKEGYKLFGSEMRLEKHDAYPIRTYVEFEAKQEEQQLDPISAILEVLAKLDPREHVWIQILVKPSDDSWKIECEKLVAQLKEETARAQKTTETGQPIFLERSPGETEIMKAIERNIAKPGFNTLIRYLYIAPPDVFKSNMRYNIRSAFNQYASEALNRFKDNFKVWTYVRWDFWPHLFAKRRQRARKIKIYENYRRRNMHPETLGGELFESGVFYPPGAGRSALGKMVLNTEELATIFHPPTHLVLTGPLLKRIESRKGGPPAGLPIYGGAENQKSIS